MNRNTVTVPVSLDSLSQIVAFVLAEADAAGLGSKARYRLRLAVDELATNIIQYGYPSASEAKSPGASIVIHAERDDNTLALILEDTGIPFDPRQVPPPADLDLPAEQRQIGGLGIYLALNGVDRFSYERAGDLNRNILVMNRPAPGG